MDEHPQAEQGEHGDRDVVGGAPDEPAERAAEEQSDDGHHHLETRHHEADTEPLAWLQSACAERSRRSEGVEPERQDEKD